MEAIAIDPARRLGPLPAIRGVMTEWMFDAGGREGGRTVDPAGVEFGYGTLLPLRREDIARAADIGVNTIRCAVEHAGLADRYRPDRYNEAGFARVAQLLDWCDEAGVDAIFDLHNALGREGGGDPRLWQQPAFQDGFVGVWREIARRFADHPRLIAYEPLNEPEPRHTDDFAVRHDVWNRLARRVTDAIRCVDADKPIIIDSIEYANASAFAGLSHTGDPHSIYSFHWYAPTAFHCQHRPWIQDQATYHYPGELRGRWWNRRTIREDLQPAVDFAARHDAPLFCGEFGCVGDCPEMEDMVWLLDVISLFDELHIGWTYYHYMFRTVEPYWREHFDCNLFIHDEPTGVLRPLERKVALLSDLMRLRGAALELAQPTDEMLHVYAVVQPDDSLRIYVSNKSRDEAKSLTLRLLLGSAPAKVAVRRLARGTGGFVEDPPIAVSGGGVELTLEPLTIVVLRVSPPKGKPVA